MSVPLSSIKKKLGLWISLSACLLLSACTTLSELSGVGAEDITHEVTAKRYAEHKTTHGIVLLDAKWDRLWRCRPFDNAQLRGFGFDRQPSQNRANDDAPDVLLAYNSSMLFASKRPFQSYALLLEPGDYALSGFTIRVARSISDISYLSAKRSILLEDGEAKGGTFTVAAGEVVYIGNFFLDCTLNTPVLWRYYTEQENWPSHQQEYKAKYPFLDLEHIHYRLFDTEEFGKPYQLE